MPTKTFLFRHTCNFITCERFLNNGWNVNEISLVDTEVMAMVAEHVHERRKLISAFHQLQ